MSLSRNREILNSNRGRGLTSDGMSAQWADLSSAGLTPVDVAISCPEQVRADNRKRITENRKINISFAKQSIPKFLISIF